MFRPKVVSISHKIDPDGIGSQAILFRYFKELKIEPIGLLADYHDFEDAFNKALEEKPNILIITDIGVNETFLSKIIVSLRDLNARKIWIDHHKMTVNQKVQISEAVTEFIHDTTVCAAELVQKRFMPNDETSKKIALIGHNGDFDINDRLTQIYYTLIDYYRNSIEDLEYIRDIFIKGNLENNFVMSKYLEAYKIFEAERDRIKKTKKELSLGGKTIVIAESQLLPRGKMTKFLEEISQKEIYLAIDTTNYRIGLRSNILDVAAIARVFGGGGHKHRSGFTYLNALDENGNLNTEFKEKLEKAILEVAF